jgi:hypothetical protein
MLTRTIADKIIFFIIDKKLPCGATAIEDENIGCFIF